MVVRFWTDGSIDSNPGTIGGWAFVAEVAGWSEEHSGAYRLEGVTNNHAEITAAIKALLYFKQKVEPCEDVRRIEIVTDSQYLLNSAIGKWRRKKNVRLLQHLDLLISGRILKGISVDWKWVKGHNGNHGNSRADILARKEVWKLQEYIGQYEH